MSCRTADGLRAAVGATGVLGILVATLGLTPAPRPGAQGASPAAFLDPCVAGLLGDVTADGTTNVIDAQQIARASAALPVSGTVDARLSTHGDVTGDATTNVIDAQQVARWSALLAVSFPIGEPMCGIEVTTVTTGLDVDPDGYALELDMAAAGTMALNETRELTELSPATYQLDLLGLASNCSVVNGTASRSVDVVEGMTAAETFEVECTRALVTMRVDAVTTGTNLPGADYVVTLDGASAQNLPINGSVEYPDLAPALYDVTLGNVPGNCTITIGGNTQEVTVDGTEDPVIATFEVNCS